MAEAVYILCALTSIACAWLLLRSFRANRNRLLFWSGAGFVGLALNNVILVVDLMIVPPSVDLSLVRTAAALLALLVLVSGLAWEVR